MGSSSNVASLPSTSALAVEALPFLQTKLRRPDRHPEDLQRPSQVAVKDMESHHGCRVLAGNA